VSGTSGPQNPVTEPNIAVFPGAGSGTAGVAPYPKGVVGTPGTLDGYCGPGDQPTAPTTARATRTC
jgi:hypothetical protein